MKKVFLAFVLVLSMSLLPGCSIISSVMDVLAEASAKDAEPELIKSASGPFSIEIPAGWEQPKEGDLNEAANLEAMDSSKELYFMSIMENKADFDLDLVGYRDFVVEYNEEVYGTSFGDPVKTKVGNYDAYAYEFHATSPDGINTYMRLFVIETENYFGQLYTWTLKSMEAENKEVLGSMVNTFKETKETTDTEAN